LCGVYRGHRSIAGIDFGGTYPVRFGCADTDDCFVRRRQFGVIRLAYLDSSEDAEYQLRLDAERLMTKIEAGLGR